ncbi:MAG: hypothetical protein WKF42_08345 [Solirubrobacteraceae bacterium]
MRPLLLGLLVTLCIPTSAAAATTPLSLPALDDEIPRALALSADRRGALVTQAGGDAGTQSVIAVPAGTRRSFPNTTVLDSVNRRDGGVDMLLRRGADRLMRAQLTLRRVMPSGRIYDLWSHDSAATVGALARGRDRTVTVWAERGGLRIITRPDGGLPTRRRDVPLGQPGTISLGLALDARGRLSMAATTPRDGLVVAALTRRGGVLRRQVYRRASGLVEMVATPAGRVGVLVEDTGIEGDGGECVADGRGRHIRAVVRERLAKRFGSLQTIESPRFGCGSGGALLRATRQEGLTAIYQGGSYDRPPLLARMAVARRGHRFSAPHTLLSDARADTAVVTRDSELVIGLLRKTVQPEVFSGSLNVFHAPDAYVQVDTGPAFAPLLALDAAGDDVLAWRTAGELRIAR